MVRDENGKAYENLKEAFDAHDLGRPNGTYYILLERNGKVSTHGHTFTLEGEVKRKPKTDPLVAKLRARYSEKELEAIARGEGIAKSYVPFPKVHLHGGHHRVLVMSDTHIGSVYSPEEWHGVVSGYANEPRNGIECILHCGDLTEGMRIARVGTQIYELSEIGYEAQRNKAVELMSMYEPTMYVISGNHDAFYKEYMGCNIVQSVCDAVPNLVYVGHDSADIELDDGCTIRLFHGGDGNSYALSYRLQKLMESYPMDSRPNILLAGHVHKFCYIYDSGKDIHAVSVPCMQQQSAWMRSKKLQAHTGFLVLDFEVEGGRVCNMAVQYFPF